MQKEKYQKKIVTMWNLQYLPLATFHQGRVLGGGSRGPRCPFFLGFILKSIVTNRLLRGILQSGLRLN